MRGLYLILGYVLGNETARKWCFENLKKASVIFDQELAKMLPPKKKEVPDRKNGDYDVKNILGSYKQDTETGARDV